jgi:hypothetical protein
VIRKLGKKIVRILLIVGVAAIPSTTPGCTDPEEPICVELEGKCGGNDPACCTGLYCIGYQVANEVRYKCVPLPEPGS